MIPAIRRPEIIRSHEAFKEIDLWEPLLAVSPLTNKYLGHYICSWLERVERPIEIGLLQKAFLSSSFSALEDTFKTAEACTDSGSIQTLIDEIKGYTQPIDIQIKWISIIGELHIAQKLKLEFGEKPKKISDGGDWQVSKVVVSVKTKMRLESDWDLLSSIILSHYLTAEGKAVAEYSHFHLDGNLDGIRDGTLTKLGTFCSTTLPRLANAAAMREEWYEEQLGPPEVNGHVDVYKSEDDLTITLYLRDTGQSHYLEIQLTDRSSPLPFIGGSSKYNSWYGDPVSAEWLRGTIHSWISKFRKEAAAHKGPFIGWGILPIALQHSRNDQPILREDIERIFREETENIRDLAIDKQFMFRLSVLQEWAKTDLAEFTLPFATRIT